MDRNEYTITRPATVAPVAAFRNATDRLFRLCNVDLPACVGADEKGRCLETIRLVASRLIATDCKRARREDWDRRERAIDRSASLVVRLS